MAVKIAKEMYAAAGAEGLTLTEYLDKERPSEVDGLDGFEFALAEQDINLRRDSVEKFYRTVDDRVLFPEFINRNVRIGMVGLSKKDVTVEDLTATETTIDSGVYQTVQAEFEDRDLDFAKVAEGAEFPTVSIQSGKNSISLAKLGIKLEASYEVLRRMKLPLMAIHMQLLGKRLAKKQAAYAVDTIVNGDGNDNPAGKMTKTLAYGNLLDFDLVMEQWEASVWLAKKEKIHALCMLDEFKDSRLFETAKDGHWVTPFGNPLKKFNWKESSLGDNQIIQVDKSAALEMVKEAGAELVETDKIIDKQFEKTVVSKVLGFSKIFTNAAHIFQVG